MMIIYFRYFRNCLAAVFFACCVMTAHQSAFAADPDVLSILGLMPAQTTEEGIHLTSELVAQGPEAIREIIDMLVPMGAGDDTKARYAIESITVYTTRPGAEKERKTYVREIVRALDSPGENEVKSFLMKQLERIGRDDAVKTLGIFLDNDTLYEPATRALVGINTKQAVRELLKALPDALDERRITIIKALGEMHAEKAVKDIIPYAETDDPVLRRTVLYALASIADPSSQKILSDAAKATNNIERSGNTSFYLLYAKRRAEKGDKGTCTDICRELLHERTAPWEANVRCSALTILVEILGEKSLDDVLTAMEYGREVRQTALKRAASLPGEAVTQRFMNELEKSTPDIAVDIIAMLGNRGDKSALPVLIDALNNPYDCIRRAAIPAAARLGGNDALPALLSVLSLDDEKETEAVMTALLSGSFDPDIIEAAITPDLPPLSRLALHEYLIRRGENATRHTEQIFSLAEDINSSVRIAAISVLGHIASENEIPGLVNLVLSSKTDAERSAAQAAAAAALTRTVTPDKRAGFVLTDLQTTKGYQRAALIEILPEIGGSEAFQTACAEVLNPDHTVRVSAIKALSQWPDPDGFVPLYNGKDLSGWFGATKTYVPEDGEIVVYPERQSLEPSGGGNLYTEKEYGNFIMRFEFKLVPNANNGLGIRTPPEGDAAYVGMELQILDNTGDTYMNLHPYQYHGSIYGVVPAKRGAQKPVGEWNYEEVIANGRRIIVRLNGTTIVDADIDEARTPHTIDGLNHPGLKRDKGHICFCGHGAKVEFRNLRIREIP